MYVNKVVIITIPLLFLFKSITGTIDLNFSELEYLSDHLLPEECRRLVAAAHFKSYMEPNALGQAENAMPKDVPCIQLLLHWNSADGEGKGETHEVLEHRLRQMGKHELADWLGKTVFNQLGKDLDESLNEGLADLVNDTTIKRNYAMPTLAPPIVIPDVKEWLPFDTICLTLILVLCAFIIGILCLVACKGLYGKYRKRQKGNRMGNEYELVGYSSNSDSDEDKFDIREHESRL